MEIAVVIMKMKECIMPCELFTDKMDFFFSFAEARHRHAFLRSTPTDADILVR